MMYALNSQGDSHIMTLLQAMGGSCMMKMGICMSNLTNLWDYRDRGMEVFPVNFPSLDGRGYAVVRLDNLNWQGSGMFSISISRICSKGQKARKRLRKQLMRPVMPPWNRGVRSKQEQRKRRVLYAA